jgi:phytol kinase
MSDLTWAAVWLGVVGAGLSVCIGLKALGLATTYVRDLLHIGAGIWIAGWPAWDRPTLPIVIACVAVIGIGLVPAAADHVRIAARMRDAVSGGDERWDGLVHYGAAYAALTAIGLTLAPVPAAAGLLALSLGDGIGGAVGRRFGRHHYRTWGKTKSYEGSVAVGLAATLGVALAARLFHQPIALAVVLGLGALAALAEALAPRGTDNLLVPAAVASAAAILT